MWVVDSPCVKSLLPTACVPSGSRRWGGALGGSIFPAIASDSKWVRCSNASNFATNARPMFLRVMDLLGKRAVLIQRHDRLSGATALRPIAHTENAAASKSPGGGRFPCRGFPSRDLISSEAKLFSTFEVSI